MATVGSRTEEPGTRGFPTLRVKPKVKVVHVSVWRSQEELHGTYLSGTVEEQQDRAVWSSQSSQGVRTVRALS